MFSFKGPWSCQRQSIFLINSLTKTTVSWRLTSKKPIHHNCHVRWCSRCWKTQTQRTYRSVNQGKTLNICILDQLNWKSPCGALIVHKYNSVYIDHPSQEYIVSRLCFCLLLVHFYLDSSILAPTDSSRSAVDLSTPGLRFAQCT